MGAARRARARLLEGVRVATALDHLDADAHGRWEALAGRYRGMRQAIDADAAHDWELSSADRLAAALERRKASAKEGSRVARRSARRARHAPPGRRDASAAPSRTARLELLYFPTDAGWLGSLEERSGRARALPRSRRSRGDARWARGGAASARSTRRSRARRASAFSSTGRSAPSTCTPSPGAGTRSWTMPSSNTRSTRATPATSRRNAPRRAPRRRSDRRPAEPLAKKPTRWPRRSASAPGWSVQDLRGSEARAEPPSRRPREREPPPLCGPRDVRRAGRDRERAPPSPTARRLTPGDVLALPSVLSFVSLFGGGTGRESAIGARDALGLANAFLAAGAQAVVATSRVVDDALARDVARAYDARLLGAFRHPTLPSRSAAPSSPFASATPAPIGPLFAHLCHKARDSKKARPAPGKIRRASRSCRGPGSFDARRATVVIRSGDEAVLPCQWYRATNNPRLGKNFPPWTSRSFSTPRYATSSVARPGRPCSSRGSPPRAVARRPQRRSARRLGRSRPRPGSTAT